MDTTGPIVYIVDDDEAVRTSVATLCATVGISTMTYATAQEFLVGFDPDQRGAIVLDLRLAGINGLDLQQRLRQKNIATPVIIITGYGEVPTAVQAMKNGAFDFLEKPFNTHQLLSVLQKAIEYDADLCDRRRHWSDTQSRIRELTFREDQVMRLMLDGCDAAEVGEKLGINHKTAQFHRKNVLDKMGVDSVVGLLLLLKDMPLSRANGDTPRHPIRSRVCTVATG